MSLGALDAQLLISATLGNRQQMQILPAVFGAAAKGDYSQLAAFKSEASRRVREARTSLLGWGTLDALRWMGRGSAERILAKTGAEQSAPTFDQRNSRWPNISSQRRSGTAWSTERYPPCG